MAASDTQDPRDRFFSALVLPVAPIRCFTLGQFILKQFPVLGIIYLPLMPLVNFYYSFPFASFIIFLVLFMAVVRNSRISYFIRFNALQAILIGILVSLAGIILNFLAPNLGIGLITETLFNLVFLGAFVVSIYGIIQSALGRRAEIPTISEAAYSQLPW